MEVSDAKIIANRSQKNMTMMFDFATNFVFENQTTTVTMSPTSTPSSNFDGNIEQFIGTWNEKVLGWLLIVEFCFYF